MAWSKEQEERDKAAQVAWVVSWAGWDEVPPSPAWGSGWNALHQQSGGGLPNVGRWLQSEVPARFWDDPADAGAEVAEGFAANGGLPKSEWWS